MSDRPRKQLTEPSKDIGELPRKPTAGSWIKDLVALKDMGAKSVDIATAMGAIHEIVDFTIVVVSDLDDVSACKELKARGFTVESTQLIEGLFAKRKHSAVVEKAPRKENTMPAPKGTRYR